jgi:hypothetical protein
MKRFIVQGDAIAQAQIALGIMIQNRFNRSRVMWYAEQFMRPDNLRIARS